MRALIVGLVVMMIGLPSWAPAHAQRTPLTIAIWFPLPTGGPLKEAMDELVTRFNSSHADIRVALELTGD